VTALLLGAGRDRPRGRAGAINSEQVAMSQVVQPPLCTCGTIAVGQCQECEAWVCGNHSGMSRGRRLCSDHHEADYDRTVRAPQREEAAELVRLLQTFVEVMGAGHVRPPPFMDGGPNRRGHYSTRNQRWKRHAKRGWPFGLGIGRAAYVLQDGTVFIPGFGGSPDEYRPIESMGPSLVHARHVRRQISDYLDEHRVRWPEDGPSLQRSGASG